LPYRVACLEGVTHGLYLLWWVQHKDLSPAIVGAILAAGDIARLGLELPTGWLADRYGHRASLLAGSAVQVIAMLWCWLGEGVPALVTASVLVAVGDAFRSGADEALLYRTCAALGRREAFVRIAARTHTIEVCALVALVVAGGLLVEAWGFAAAWIAETALCAAGIVIAFAMIEPAADETCSAAPTGEAATPSCSRVLSVPMTLLVLPAALLAGASGIGSFVAQASAARGAAEVTMLVALLTIAEAAGAALAPRVPAAHGRGQAALAACGGLVVMVAAIVPGAFHAMVAALAFLEGLAEPLRAAAIQREAPEGARAQAASVAGALDMAVTVVALPLAGYFSGHRR
jgi:MFS family permease